MYERWNCKGDFSGAKEKITPNMQGNIYMELVRLEAVLAQLMVEP